ncbi:hypothetical protein CR513_35608, partial [Mucuna pruriens]
MFSYCAEKFPPKVIHIWSFTILNIIGDLYFEKGIESHPTNISLQVAHRTINHSLNIVEHILVKDDLPSHRKDYNRHRVGETNLKIGFVQAIDIVDRVVPKNPLDPRFIVPLEKNLTKSLVLEILKTLSHTKRTLKSELRNALSKEGFDVNMDNHLGDTQESIKDKESTALQVPMTRGRLRRLQEEV